MKNQSSPLNRRARRGWRASTIVGLGVATTMMFSACAAPAQTAGEKDGSTTVRIALQPLLDYVPWVFAEEHGLTEEQGLNLEISYLPQVNTALQAMARGDLDMVSTCTACNLPYVESVPTLRDVLIVNQFKGFIIVGRTGAPEYNELVAGGASEDEARQEIYDYIKGKTFIGNEAIFGALVNGLLDYAGLSQDDITIVDLADDAKAATAFLQGQGDFYMGSLAQESKLLNDFPDQFVNVGGAEVLGAGGLWYGTAAVDQSYLESNRETVEKLVAVWMRTARYINEEPKTIVPVLVDALNEHAGATFTADQIDAQLRDYVQFVDPTTAAEDTYNPESSLYWKNSLRFYAEQNQADGNLAADVDLDDFNVQEKVYKDVIENEELMSWVNSPLS